MKTICRAVFATLLAAAALSARPAYAQINGANETTEQVNPLEVEPSLTKGIRSSVLLGYSPVATFASAGSFANGVQGTQTNVGQLFEGDLVFRSKHVQGRDVLNRVGLGGWYWTRGNGDVYQVHGRVFFSEQFGMQAAYLSSTSHVAPGPSYTLFLIYQLSSRYLAGGGHRKPFGIEVGLGTYIDPTNFPNSNSVGPTRALTTLGFSSYINGSLSLGKKFSLNASQWYIRDRTADLTRFTLGLGYHF